MKSKQQKAVRLMPRNTGTDHTIRLLSKLVGHYREKLARNPEDAVTADLLRSATEDLNRQLYEPRFVPPN